MEEYLISRVQMERWGEPRNWVSALLYPCAPGSGVVSERCAVVEGGFSGK